METQKTKDAPSVRNNVVASPRLGLQERIGEMFLIGYVTVFSIFPVVANYAAKAMPPIMFAGASSIVAAFTIFLYLTFSGKLGTLLNKKAFPYIMGVTVFGIIIPFVFIFTGTSKTSGINTTLLLQTEILFTYIFCWLFFKEKISYRKCIGGLTILIGAIAVLYNGSFKLNLGDFLIIAGVVSYPFANRCSKKALEFVDPAVIICIRGAIGGVFLLLISFVFEEYTSAPAQILKIYWPIILFNGAFMLGAAKFLWFAGLKRLDISKAVSISIAEPAFGLVYAYIFLREVPTIYQLAGVVIIIFGLYLLTFYKKHVPEPAEESIVERT